MLENDADDIGEVSALLEQVDGEIISFIADGAYDGDPVYQAVARQQHDPPPDVVIPPRASAALSTDSADQPSQRDRHIRTIAEKGRMAGRKQPATAGVAWWRRQSADTMLTRTAKHLNRHGRIIDILVWTGRCATCGAAFEATSPKSRPETDGSIGTRSNAARSGLIFRCINPVRNASAYAGRR